MRAQPIIPGGPWTIFTWVIVLMVTGIMVTEGMVLMSGAAFQSGYPMGIHRGITLITVIFPPGTTRTIATPIIATGDGMGITASPITPVGEAATVTTGVEVMTVTQAMAAITPATAETVVPRIKTEMKIQVIVAMEIARVVTELHPLGVMYPPPRPGIPVTREWS